MLSSPQARTAARVASASRWWRGKTLSSPSSCSMAIPPATPLTNCCPGGEGKKAELVEIEHVLPAPERFAQFGAFRGRERLVADGVERHAGRQHQSLLRAT